MALYTVLLRQRYFEQICINTWDYYCPPLIGSTPTALELITLMGFIPEGDPLAFPEDTLAYNLSFVQNTDLQYLTVEARELYSLVDFYEGAFTPPLTGEVDSGNGMSPTLAAGMFSERLRLDIRRSTKRFAGQSEGMIEAGGVLGATLQSNMAALAASMSEILTGVTAVYEPCTIARQKVVDEETGKVSYVLYPTESEQEEHVAHPLEWSIYDRVRTQVSRQYGRGD